MKVKGGKRCFCSSCWREEYHSPLRLDAFTRAVLIVITLGLAIFFWPHQCQCCGSLRPQRWLPRSIGRLGR